jgi:pimeloyl-ACP methyl ester carboxylesterase
MRRTIFTALTICLALPLASRASDDTTTSSAPVKVIADHLLPVSSPRGTGNLPLYISLDQKSIDFAQPQPAVTRALIIFHGKLRDADVYNESGLHAIKTAAAEKNTLLITPQFLGKNDTDAFHLLATTLRWAPEAWMGGMNAIDAAGAETGPSSFDAIDAILLHLTDRKIFPNLKNVVLAGHSGGGQVVQRYAVVGRADDALLHAGIHVRYVIANPSTYLYFSPDRPALDAKTDFAFGPPARTCYGKFDKWKYGINEPPPYAGNANFSELESRYLRRDVVYLLGTNDVDPNHPALDKTCSAEVEGPYRFYRGKAFFRYMELRHPELAMESASQKLEFVPGVEHDGDKMFNSACGLNALFDIGVCGTRVRDPKPSN